MKSRLVEWNDPRSSLAAAEGVSGLEYLRGVLGGEFPPPPMALLMRLQILEVESGRVVFGGTPGEEHYNPHGTVHGGWPCTIFDTALGCAVHSTLPAGIGYTTLELHVNFVRPLTLQSGAIRCEANVLHLGKRVATAEAKMRDAAGTLMAHATTTCLIMPRRPREES